MGFKCYDMIFQCYSMIFESYAMLYVKKDMLELTVWEHLNFTSISSTLCNTVILVKT